MATMKRENPTQEEQQLLAKRLKNVASHEYSHQSLPKFGTVLNPADCDLAFNIDADGLTGHALYEQGFSYCWSGARGNIGITGGKYCFGCKIIYNQPVIMEDTPLDQQHLCRVGISRGDDPVGNLGETKSSFGYGGTGKFSTDGRFVDYGERFGFGDTIVCSVDLESKPFASIEFSKNGKRLGMANYFDAGPIGLGVIDSPAGHLPWGSACFPHVLLKNTVVEMQFSMEDGLLPEEGYKPWASAVNDGKAVIGPAFSEPQDCEVIMLVGLPASGKTTWAEKWIKQHPEKRYILLGTNLALDQMKVPGLLRKFNYGERYDHLVDQATGIFNTLLSRASKISRNYIIDQTNVYKSARRRKLKPFAYFRKIAVVVFPRQEELKLRGEKRVKEMGKELPPEAVNEMLANFVLPMSKEMHGTDEYFDEVIYTDLSGGEAQQHLDEMKHALLLSSSMNSMCDHSPYPRESCAHSDSRLSAGSLPGPGHPYSGYSRPLLGLQTDLGTGGSWIGHHELALRPNPANANRGYTGVGNSAPIEPMQPFSCNVNTSYEGPTYASYRGSSNPMPSRDGYPGAFSSYSSPSLREDGGYPRPYSSYNNPDPSNNFNPVPGNNLAQYGSYMPDPQRTHEASQAAYSYGFVGFGNSAEEARSAYWPPYVSPFGISYSRPQGSYPADVQHPETAPYHPSRYY